MMVVQKAITGNANNTTLCLFLATTRTRKMQPGSNMARIVIRKSHLHGRIFRASSRLRDRVGGADRRHSDLGGAVVLEPAQPAGPWFRNLVSRLVSSHSFSFLHHSSILKNTTHVQYTQTS